MSEHTIESLMAENQALKAKNAELLDELKRAKKSRESEGLKYDALLEEHEAVKKRLHGYTLDGPVNAIFEELSGKAGKMMRREFEDHFDIVEEDGLLKLRDKQGNPVQKVVKNGYREEYVEVPFDADAIRQMIWDGGLESLEFFLPKPKGSGAPGSTSRAPVTRNEETEKAQESQQNTPKFGMR